MPLHSGSRAPVAVFALALAVRVAYVLELRGHDLFAVKLGDAAFFDAWARRIAAGELVGEGAYYQAPGYAWFLGAVYAVLGASTLAARLVQAALGAAACALVALAAGRVATPRTGAVAGALLALHAPAIALEGMLVRDALALFGVALLFSALTRPPSALRAAAVGALAVSLALVRENMVVLAPIALVWLARGGRGGRGVRARLAGAALLGALLALSPLVARNVAAGVAPLAASSNLGQNLWIGNHPGADGLFVPFRPGRAAPDEERADAEQLAEAALGRQLEPGEVSAHWRDRALAWMRAEPAAALALFARKARLLVHDEEWMDVQSYAFCRRESRVLGALGILFRGGVLVALACAGAVAGWSERRRLALPYLALALLLATTAAFFVFGRFRAPLWPFLATFAAVGLVAILERARTEPRRLVAPLAALALGALVAFAPTGVVDDPIAATHANLGAALRAAGERDAAEHHLRAALARQPDDPDAHDAVLALAEVELARGARDAARARLAEIDPAGLAPDEQHRLGRLLRAADAIEAAEAAYRASLAARDDADVRNDLGWLLQVTGRLLEAAQEYERALELDGGATDALFNLARLRSAAPDPALRDGEQALALAARAAERFGSDDVDVLDVRAMALAELGRFGEATAMAWRAARRAQELGRSEGARECARRARWYAAGRPLRFGTE